MASQPVITGAPTRAPSIPALPRRSFLGALAAAPALAIAPAGTALPRADRSMWDRAVAAFYSAKRAYEHHDADVWQPLNKRLTEVAPRPDLRFEVVAKNGRSAIYHVNPDRLHDFDDHISSVFREKAAAVREAWLNHLAVRERMGWDVATDENERLSIEQCNREFEAILVPAPDREALLWKLDHLFGAAAGRCDGDDNDAYSGEYIDVVMADAARLLSTGRA